MYILLIVISHIRTIMTSVYYKLREMESLTEAATKKSDTHFENELEQPSR